MQPQEPVIYDPMPVPDQTPQQEVIDDPDMPTDAPVDDVDDPSISEGPAITD